ncbi:MAG TPA: DUF1844 domain-containing protein [Ignavibacteria bacterium]|nr:DUF1844 domain-containing protein [Ignavibacteria bacterium]
METESPLTNEQVLFMQLIMQNQQIAMMAMGKLKNPVTNKIDRNLDYAKVSIDTLDMIAVKTKGNLSDYEEKYLTEVLKELKLNYVEEVNKDETTDSAKSSSSLEEKSEEENGKK